MTLADIKPGMRLVVTDQNKRKCLTAGETVEVLMSPRGHPFVRCHGEGGRHFLMMAEDVQDLEVER